MTVKQLPSENIYWRDVVAAKPITRLEGGVYVVINILCPDEGDGDTYFLKESVVFWHGQEARAAQRALDALIDWQEKTQQESIDRIKRKVLGAAR